MNVQFATNFECAARVWLRRGWLCSALALVVFVPLALACSSSSNNNAGSTSTSAANGAANQKAANTNAAAPANSGQSNTNSSGQSSTGTKLSDCAYAAKFQSATSTLQSVTSSVTSSTPVSGAVAVVQAAKQYAQAGTAVQQIVTDLKGVGLSSADVKKVNDQIVSIYGDAGKQFTDAEKSATSGDATKAADIFSKASTDIKAKVDKLRTDNKGVFDRIDTCNKK